MSKKFEEIIQPNGQKPREQKDKESNEETKPTCTRNHQKTLST